MFKIALLGAGRIGRIQPAIGYADGVAAPALAEAAGESLKTGRPVSL
jgi:hypothetical protein